MTYGELLEHIESNCTHQLKCPAQCSDKIFKSVKELRHHITKVCVFTVLHCKVCNTQVQRLNISKSHTQQDCLNTLLKRNKRIQDLNHELEKEIRKFEQDSYFREDSDFSSAFSDDSALDLDDDDEDEDDENSNESEST